MLYAADFRARAREALRGNWGIAVGVGLVASLLGAGTTAAGSAGGNGNSNANSGVTSGAEAGTGLVDFGSIDSIADLNGIIPTEYQVGFMVFLSVLSFIGVLFLILHFTIGGAITLGYVKFNLNLVDRKHVTFAQLFSEFHRFGAGFFMQLLRMLYTFLWSLLFVIPGIYAAYGYSMTPYILAEHPEMTANEAITRSKELMDGNRFRLFCLEISFLGWALLVALFTLGIGLLWLKPYIETSFAAFYREITAEKYGREEKKEEFYEGYYSGRIV